MQCLRTSWAARIYPRWLADPYLTVDYDHKTQAVLLEWAGLAEQSITRNASLCLYTCARGVCMPVCSVSINNVFHIHNLRVDPQQVRMWTINGRWTDAAFKQLSHGSLSRRYQPTFRPPPPRQSILCKLTCSDMKLTFLYCYLLYYGVSIPPPTPYYLCHQSHREPSYQWLWPF